MSTQTSPESECDTLDKQSVIAVFANGVSFLHCHGSLPLASAAAFDLQLNERKPHNFGVFEVYD